MQAYADISAARAVGKDRAVMEIVGHPPKLAGLLCDALICEAFVRNGELLANANVVHLCFEGVWYRLVLDCGVMIWRQSIESPKPWAIEELGWQYPHVNVGEMAGVIGRRLEYYRMDSLPPSGADVMFSFDNGCTVVINNAEDRSTFRIT
ncbi:hypothetical protein IVA95_31985 [Bradyrhizobium sp. 157]|uniref:hypothetical protein n=1 Tax=Bradyrhizobium sp. 157 TaxID=2782631 RepID=UPI001FF994AB|nr:hypothetical protein [Bradyrhizobium sp. 157]MCK1642049.1 hypothetical protein [Bradyrhizobium sp. 157]